MTVEERYIVVDGIRTHITQSGSGKPLILIHGLGGPLMWQRVIEPLAREFRIVCVDLPGFGDSDPLPSTFSTKEYCNFLLHLLEELNVEKTIVVGISYGGQIAANFSCLYSGKVDKLILIDSTGLSVEWKLVHNKFLWFLFKTIAKYIVFRNERLTCLLGRRSFYKIKNRPPGLCEKFFKQLSQTGKRDAWLNGFRNVNEPSDELRQNLSKLQIPALIIWGNNDLTVPVKYAKEFRKLVPNSELQIFLETAHSLPLEQPQELCKSISVFCSK